MTRLVAHAQVGQPPARNARAGPVQKSRVILSVTDFGGHMSPEDPRDGRPYKINISRSLETRAIQPRGLRKAPGLQDGTEEVEDEGRGWSRASTLSLHGLRVRYTPEPPPWVTPSLSYTC
ncbi:Hypothetical protein NTJ_07258 [Nesidiocoris tenuis]|uniref:Uncharacterized protein n=1 Tax=Nesidiocoris tenuis TaxID=355587 RepID=A0ABN7AQH0_9HEMI|nr:Hypothetical protein NTJ_07258 [Nesidiocoris tenuis]